MPRGIIQWTRDPHTHRSSSRLVMYPAQTAIEKHREMLHAELLHLGRTWAVLIGGEVHQYGRRDDAEFEFLAARNAQLV